MQKKLMAVAVAGALVAPALAMAQSSTVQIYGRMTVEYSYMDRGQGTEKGDGLQTPGGSSIGFKGEEKLGGGLSAWFQCESSADVTEGGDGTCTRNSALGFKGGFGNFYIGRWDTPFKQASSLGAGVGSESTGTQGNSALMVGSSTGRIGLAGRNIWERRQANTINYNSPKFGGFDVRAAYSTLEATGLATGANKPRLWSLAGIYNAGPLAIGVGYEMHKDAGNAAGGGVFSVNPATGVIAASAVTANQPGLDDTAIAISAKYKFGKLLVGGGWNKQEYEIGTAGATTERDAWNMGVEYNISGPHNIEASYSQAGDMKGTAGTATPGLPTVGGNTGAKQYQVAYRHLFSKRTEARLAYVVVDNESGTNLYTLNGLSASPAPLGAKQKAISLLVKHTF